MYTIAAFYQFTHLADYAAHRAPLLALAKDQRLCGSIPLAPEGVNGTIGGTKDGIDALLDALHILPGCAGLEHKESTNEEKPFLRMKVRLKKEIVTMGIDADARGEVGTYVDIVSCADIVTHKHESPLSNSCRHVRLHAVAANWAVESLS